LRQRVPARVEQRQDHDGLSETHVVRQTAAKVEPAQELHPAKRLALIFPQRALKGRRRIDRRDSAEGVQLTTKPRKRLIVGNRRLGGEERVEQRRLWNSEADGVAVRRGGA